MPQDRDQLTPADPDDAEHLRTHRGQGSAGTGHDRLEEDTDRDADEAEAVRDQP